MPCQNGTPFPSYTPLPTCSTCPCSLKKISVSTAQLIHNTLIAMLVTGSHVPPARLHTIKTAMHPEYAERLLCQDPDCLYPEGGCMGNRFEVHKGEGEGGEGVEVVRYIAPHHKNDRRGSNQVLCYDLPSGPISELMLIHIREGHEVLTHFLRHAQPHLFMSSSGMEFSDVLFANWWHVFYHSSNGPQPYFPPSKGRTLFVESFIASTGHQPQESWEGAALAMGNSVKQWREFYAPRMKHMLAQEAVHSHQGWREGMVGKREQRQHGGVYGPSSSAPPPGGVPDLSEPHVQHAPASAFGHAAADAAMRGGVHVKREGGVSSSKVKREVEPKAEVHRDSAPAASGRGVKAEAAQPAPSFPMKWEREPTTSSGPPPAPSTFFAPSSCKRVKVEHPPASVITPPYQADDDETEAAAGWGPSCSEGWGPGEEQQQQQQQQEQQLGEEMGWEEEGGAWCGEEGDDDVVITRVVPPGCRRAQHADMIDLTALSSSGSDSDEEL